MKAVLIFLLSTFAYEMAECSLANFLADRVLARMSSWVQAEGSAWVTLPGYFEGGVVQGKTNDNFTLAFAGPAFELNGSLTRTSEATLIDGPTDPIYGSDQRLTFNVAVKNVTVKYLRVAYNDDDYGFFNLTSMATSDGLSATLSIDLKGSGDSCIGFVNDAAVSFTGALYVTTGGVRFSFPKVIDAVTSHFKTNVPNSIGLLMKTATFNSLDGYDICSGAYNPLPQANVMAMRILNVMQDGLNQNMQYWAVLPAFSKTSTDMNGTMDEIVVRVGNFSSIGTLRSVEASYVDEENLKFQNLTVGVEVSDLTGVYGYMEYIDYESWYVVGEKVTANKLALNLSLRCSRPSVAEPLSCVNATVSATANYDPSGGPLSYINLTPHVDDYFVESVNKVLGPAFISYVGEAASDLFRKAAEYAVSQLFTDTEICGHLGTGKLNGFKVTRAVS